jgi:hypothetical protein
MAYPRSVRVGGRRSFVISIETTPAGRILAPARSFRALTPCRDSVLRELALCRAAVRLDARRRKAGDQSHFKRCSTRQASRVPVSTS